MTIVKGIRDLVELLWGHESMEISLLTASGNSRAGLEISRLLGGSADCQSDCWCRKIDRISGEDVFELSNANSGKSMHCLRLSIHGKRVDERMHVSITPLELRVDTQDSITEKVENNDAQNRNHSRVNADSHEGIKFCWMDETTRPLNKEEDLGKIKRKITDDKWRKIETIIFKLWGPSGDMCVAEILRCQQLNLYRTSGLKKLLSEAVFIPLPSSFIDWLKSDNFILDSETGTKQNGRDTFCCRKDSFASSIWSNESDENSSEVEPYQKSEEFLELLVSIDTAIDKLGGEAFPKLNWSSAKDAKWILGGKLMCETSREVLLLFKSSAWIFHDVDKAFSKAADLKCIPPEVSCVDYQLCLKRPLTIMEGMEFRIFFWDCRLLGVSQRDLDSCYEFLANEPDTRDTIRALIDDFFQTKFFPNFKRLPVPELPESIEYDIMSRGAFDIYFTKEGEKGPLNCRLLDVSPWGATTDPLLFDWDELRDKAWKDLRGNQDQICSNRSDTCQIELRYVEAAGSNKRCNPESYQRFPQDVLDFYTSEFDEIDAEKLVEVMRNQTVLE